MRRPQFTLKTLLWLATLVAAGAGVTSYVVRHEGQEIDIFAWLTMGAVVGGSVGLFVREPLAFLLFGIVSAFLLALLLATAAILLGGR